MSMKLWLIVLLFLTSCGIRNPHNLKYADKIKVTDGFYAGLIGTIDGTWHTMDLCQTFGVNLDVGKYAFISSCDMEKLND